MRKMGTMIVFAGLLVVSVCRKFSVSCRTCSTIECFDGNKCLYLFGNDGAVIDEEICTGSSFCNEDKKLEINAVKCDIDALAQQCDSKVCLNFDEFSVCDPLSGLSCQMKEEMGMNIQTKKLCKKCETTPNCQYCLIDQSGVNGQKTNLEGCADQFLEEGGSCDWIIEGEYGRCERDMVGRYCDCCLDLKVTGDTGECVDNDPIFSQSQQLGSYASGWLLVLSLGAFLMLVLI